MIFLTFNKQHVHEWLLKIRHFQDPHMTNNSKVRPALAPIMNMRQEMQNAPFRFRAKATFPFFLTWTIRIRESPKVLNKTILFLINVTFLNI